MVRQMSASVFYGISVCVGFHFLGYKPFMVGILSILIPVLITCGKKPQRKLPPGPHGVPVLGYLPYLGKLPHQKMTELAQENGPLMYIQLGSIPGLVVSSPQMMREVLVTQDHIFGSRPQASTMKKYFGLGRNSLANAALGPEYKNMRRLYTQKLQSPQMVASFQPVRSEETKDMVRGLWEDGKGGDSVNLNRALVAMATIVTTRMVMQKRRFNWKGLMEYGSPLNGIAELLRHPMIMHKLQKELDTIVGSSRIVQESDLPNLPYLEAVMRETFRLHPIGPLLFPHESTEATEIEGYDIPAQTRVFFNIRTMARDPSVWDRPTEFDLDRFLYLTEMEKQDQKVKFMPLGSGRRSCPGKHAGSLGVSLAVAHLVHCFDWSSREELDMTEVSGGASTMMNVPLSHLHMQPRPPTYLYTD